MGAPQIIVIVMMTMAVTLHMIKHGEKRDPYNGHFAFIGAIINLALLYWGGFFS